MNTMYKLEMFDFTKQSIAFLKIDDRNKSLKETVNSIQFSFYEIKTIMLNKYSLFTVFCNYE